MITGHSTARVQDARDAGVNEFLTKPVTARSWSTA
jgi:two-component system chemotaxis response regulator CheY